MEYAELKRDLRIQVQEKIGYLKDMTDTEIEDFTVEAALVIPLVISVLTMTIFLFVYQYDRCLMEQDVGMLALYAGTLATKDTEEMTKQISRRAAERYTDKYVFWRQTKIDIYVRKDRVEIVGEGSTVMPLPEWNLLNNEKGWNAKVIRRISRLSPTEIIRLGHRIKRSE